MQRIATDDATPPAGKSAVAATRSPGEAIPTPTIYEFTAYRSCGRRRITRFRISVMSSMAKRTPSRPRPLSFTPP
jgi:hypothetical protein